MIRFFRKIRQKLLAENKLSRYLAYAVGEILLVVIGILIALQIDNWNEKEKQKREATVHLKNMSDFIYSALGNSYRLDEIQRSDSSFTAILNRDTSNSFNYRFNPISFYIYESEWDNIFDVVLENQKLYPESHERLIVLLRQMKVVKEGFINSSAKILLEMETKNNEIISSNFKWHSLRDEESLQKRKEYYLTDFYFQNRLYDFRRKYLLWASQITRVQALQIQIWIELKRLSAFEDNKTLLDGLHHFQMTELKEVDCSLEQSPEKNYNNLLLWTVLINHSTDTLFFSREPNSSEEHYIEKISPGETGYCSTLANRYLYIFNKNSCTNALKVEINGYWIKDE